jgi:hypothetical protein
MGIVCGASGRFNLTQVGLHWDAFSFSIVASDSWFNPISRRNHSSGIVVDLVVAGSGSGSLAGSDTGVMFFLTLDAHDIDMVWYGMVWHNVLCDLCPQKIFKSIFFNK